MLIVSNSIKSDKNSTGRFNNIGSMIISNDKLNKNNNNNLELYNEREFVAVKEPPMFNKDEYNKLSSEGKPLIKQIKQNLNMHTNNNNNSNSLGIQYDDKGKEIILNTNEGIQLSTIKNDNLNSISEIKDVNDDKKMIIMNEIFEDSMNILNSNSNKNILSTKDNNISSHFSKEVNNNINNFDNNKNNNLNVFIDEEKERPFSPPIIQNIQD
jgi:hypothetical protein